MEPPKHNYAEAWAWQEHNKNMEAYNLKKNNAFSLNGSYQGQMASELGSNESILAQDRGRVNLGDMPLGLQPFSYELPSQEQFEVASRPPVSDSDFFAMADDLENFQMLSPYTPSFPMQPNHMLLNMPKNNFPGLEELLKDTPPSNEGPQAQDSDINIEGQPDPTIGVPESSQNHHGIFEAQQSGEPRPSTPNSSNTSMQNMVNPFTPNVADLKTQGPKPGTVQYRKARQSQLAKATLAPPPFKLPTPQPFTPSPNTGNVQFGDHRLPVAATPAQNLCSMGFGSQSHLLPKFPKEVMIVDPNKTLGDDTFLHDAAKQTKALKALSANIGKSSKSSLPPDHEPEYPSLELPPTEAKDYLSSFVFTGKPCSDVPDLMPEALKNFEKVPEFKGNPNRIADLKGHINELTMWGNGFAKSAIRGYERLERRNKELNENLEIRKRDMGLLWDAAQELRPSSFEGDITPLELLRGYVLENQDLATALEKAELKHSKCPPISTDDDEEAPNRIFEMTLEEHFNAILTRKNKEIDIHQQSITEKDAELERMYKKTETAKMLVAQYQVHLQDLVNRCRVFETFKKKAKEDHENMIERVKKLKEENQETKTAYSNVHRQNSEIKKRVERLGMIQAQQSRSEKMFAEIQAAYNATLNENHGLKKRLVEVSQLGTAHKELEERLMNLNSAYASTLAEKASLEQQLAGRSQTEPLQTQQPNTHESLTGELSGDCQILMAEKNELQNQCHGYFEWNQYLERQAQELSDAHFRSLLECESMRLRLELAGLPPKVYRKKFNSDTGENMGEDLEVEREEVCMTIDEIRDLMQLDRFREPFIQQLMREGDERWKFLSQALELQVTNPVDGLEAGGAQYLVQQ